MPTATATTTADAETIPASAHWMNVSESLTASDYGAHAYYEATVNADLLAFLGSIYSPDQVGTFRSLYAESRMSGHSHSDSIDYAHSTIRSLGL